MGQNIIIKPNKDGVAEQPKIDFVGADAGASGITLKVLGDSGLSFEGTAGQLFSINNNLSTGKIFSVNDISGIPSIDVDADGTVRLNPFNGIVYSKTLKSYGPISGTGAGNSLTLSAGSGVGAFKGGDLILRAGLQGSSGGDGSVAIQQETGQTGNLMLIKSSANDNLFTVDNDGNLLSKSRATDPYYRSPSLYGLQPSGKVAWSIVNNELKLDYVHSNSNYLYSTLGVGFNLSNGLRFHYDGYSTFAIGSNRDHASTIWTLDKGGGSHGGRRLAFVFSSVAAQNEPTSSFPANGELLSLGVNGINYWPNTVNISANTNNLAHTATAALRINCTVASDITGMIYSFARHMDGRIVELRNVGTQDITLKNKNSNSYQNNRFVTITGLDYIVAPNDVVSLVYDFTLDNGSTGLSILSVSRTSGVATFITSSDNFIRTAYNLVISGMSDNSFNGTYVASSSENDNFINNQTRFIITNAGPDLASTAMTGLVVVKGGWRVSGFSSVSNYTKNLSAVPVGSGAGNALTISAGSGVTSGAGANLILNPGEQATTGGRGSVLIDGLTVGRSKNSSGLNTAVGVSALAAITIGASNTAIGYQSLQYNTAGDTNTANGHQALYNNTLGSANAANGHQALYSNTTGNFNTAIGGRFALYSNTTGSTNTAIGVQALYYNTGDSNTAIGNNAGFSLTTGSNNTFLGYSAGYNASQLVSASNSMALGNGAFTTASNQVVIGNTSVTQTLLNGNVGIGTTSPTEKLSISGSGQVSAAISSTNSNATVTLQYNGASKWYIGNFPSTHDYIIYNATPTPVFVIKQTGLIGIGLELPTANLHIKPAAAATKGLIVQGAASQTANLQEWQDSAGTALGVVTAAGRVGIGTASPAYALEVTDMTSGYGIRGMRITTNSQSAGPMIRLDMAGSVATNWLMATSWDVTHSFAIRSSNSLGGDPGDAGTARLTISNTGNIGIGTTSPSARTHIVTAAATKGLIVQGAASQTANLQEWQNSAGTVLASVSAAGGHFANTLSAVAVTSGAGNSLTIAAGSGIGTGSGANLILNPGEFATSGTRGSVLIDGLTVGKGKGSGAENTVVGAGALAANTTGQQSVAIGYNALQNNTGGTNNVAVGFQSQRAHLSGRFNTSMGWQTLEQCTSGEGNTALGYVALASLAGGSYNTAIGHFASYSVTGGSFNVTVGFYAGNDLTTGANNTLVGRSAAIGSGNGAATDSIVIGANAVGKGSNTTVIGTTSTTATWLYGTATTNALAAMPVTSGAGNALTISAGSGVTSGAGANLILNPGEQATTGGRGTVLIDGLTVGKGKAGSAENTVVGKDSLAAITTGEGNTAIGTRTLAFNTTSNSNTAVGHGALYLNTGSENTAIGTLALLNNTASGITAIGFEALRLNTTGTSNLAIGHRALRNNINGNQNVAIGTQSLVNSNGLQNVGVGYSTLANNGLGEGNVALGYSALSELNGGYYNTAIGYLASIGATGGNYNITIGYNTGDNLVVGGNFNVLIGYLANMGAGNGAATNSIVIGKSSVGKGSNTTVIGNTSTTATWLYGTVTSNALAAQPVASGAGNALTISAGSGVTSGAGANLILNPGEQATTGGRGSVLIDGLTVGKSKSSGIGNTAVGANALLSITSGNYSTAIGASALASATSAGDNTAIGASTLGATTTGYANTAIGAYVLQSNTTGINNTGIGSSTLQVNTTGYSNTGIGTTSLFFNTIGHSNTAIGVEALRANTTGINNTATGTYALRANNEGRGSVATGVWSLYSNTTGIYNIATGVWSLYSNTTGSSNVAIGTSSLYYGTGNSNTAIGDNAGGSITTGSNNTFLGSSSGLNASQLVTASNSMALGNGAFTTASNQVVIGNTSVTQTLLNGNVGIGTTNPVGGSVKLTVYGSIYDFSNTDGGNSFLFSGSAGINYGNIRNEVGGDKWSLGYTASPVSTGTAVITYASSGNVGIGTTSPGGLLHLYSSTSGALGRVVLQSSTNDNATSGTNIEWWASNNIPVGRISNVLYASGRADMRFSTFAGGNDATERMRIDYLGNVGIGTASPVVSLAVNGTIAVNSTIIGSSNGGSTVNAGLNLNGSGGGGAPGVTLQNGGVTVLEVGGNSASLYGVRITPTYATRIGLIAKGAASQTANLQEWQNSAGTALSYVNATGNPFANSLSSVPVTSGAGNSLTIAAGSGIGTGSGANLILNPGEFATSGTRGNVLIDGLTVGKSKSSGVDNTVVGAGSLAAITTGQDNTAFGRNTLAAITAGNGNTAIGRSALQNYTSSNSTAIGTGALQNNTGGSSNTAIGMHSMLGATGSHNSAVGKDSLYSVTGSHNNSIGFESLGGVTSGNNNTAIGSGVGAYGTALTTGSDNTLVGYRADMGVGNSAATNSIVIGANAIGKGSNTTVIGTTSTTATWLYGTVTTNALAAQPVTSGAGNALTISAGSGVTSGAGANLILNPGEQATTGGRGSVLIDGITVGKGKGSNVFNTAVGTRASDSINAGSDTTALGYEALRFNTGGQNTAVGVYALYSNTSASANIAIGNQALFSNTTGGGNVAVGSNSMDTSNGSFNTAIGHVALRASTSGNENVAVGMNSLRYNTTGSGNTASGSHALHLNTTGIENTASGRYAGLSLTTGSNNTFLGSSAGYNASQLVSASNSMALGNGAFTTASNQVVIGNTSVTQTLLNGNVGIGTTSPGARLSIVSSDVSSNVIDIRQTGVTGYSAIRMLDSGNAETGGFGYANASAGLSTLAGKQYYFSMAKDMVFTYDYNTTGAGVIIKNGGNVGIGTTAPLLKLHIDGNMRVEASDAQSSSEGLTINCPTGMNYGFVHFHNAARNAALTGSTLKWSMGYNYAPELGINGAGFAIFQANANTRLYINSSGNVGIGTTSPAARTHIVTTAAVKGLIVQGAASQSVNLQEWQNSAGTALAYVDAAGNFNGSAANLTNFPTLNQNTTGTASGAQAINTQTGITYTLVLADGQKLVTFNNVAAISVSVPTNASVAFPIGTGIDILQLGAGIVTFVAAGGVTLNGTPGLKTRVQYSGGTLLKVGTDSWVIVGDTAV